jgi:hypothetical protein
VKRDIAQDAEQNHRSCQEPGEKRAGHKAGPLPARESPRNLAQTEPQPNWKKSDDQRIQTPGGSEVAMRELMHGSQSAATRALQACHFMQGADREKARRRRIEDK